MTWAVVTDEWGYPQIVDADGRALAFVRSGCEEQARLMAAAPSLYEALRQIASDYSYHDEMARDHKQIARAALAKVDA